MTPPAWDPSMPPSDRELESARQEWLKEIRSALAPTTEIETKGSNATIAELYAYGRVVAKRCAVASVAHALHERAPMTREALADFLMHDQPSSYQFFLGKPGAVGRDYCLNVADAILAHFSPAALHERDGAPSGLTEAESEEANDLYTRLESQADPYALTRTIEHFLRARRSPVQERGAVK